MTTALKDSLGLVIGGKIEEKLLTSFFVLYKNARIIEENNATFQKQADGFLNQLTSYSDDASWIELKTVNGRYFLNEKLVRFDDRGMSGAHGVVSEWRTFGVGGITFDPTITLEELTKFIKFISGIRPGRQDFDAVALSLKKESLSKVKLLSAREVQATQPASNTEVRRQFRAAARTTFFKAMSVVEEVMSLTQQDQKINVSKTKRVVHTLIDHITRDESSLIELSAIKNFDDYTYAHSTNVCIYALTLGVRLGFDRARLSQLGFTALFHDVGKVKLPRDLIRKPDAFDENDWIQMQLHPILGAKTILRNLRFDAHSARAARGAFEHHINADFTGYPVLRYKKRKPNLFSRIISVVDTFDALTSGRVYLKEPIAPDEVLRKMHFQMKIKFDPFLLGLFNDIIGIYPAGSVVLLSTDELALVLTNNEQVKDRPFIKIVGNRSGLLEIPEWVDLSQDEQSHRKIVRRVEPERYGLDPKEFILRD